MYAYAEASTQALRFNNKFAVMRKQATAECIENSLPYHTELAEVWGDLEGLTE